MDIDPLAESVIVEIFHINGSLNCIDIILTSFLIRFVILIDIFVENRLHNFFLELVL